MGDFTCTGVGHLVKHGTHSSKTQQIFFEKKCSKNISLGYEVDTNLYKNLIK